VALGRPAQVAAGGRTHLPGATFDMPQWVYPAPGHRGTVWQCPDQSRHCAAIVIKHPYLPLGERAVFARGWELVRTPGPTNESTDPSCSPPLRLLHYAPLQADDLPSTTRIHPQSEPTPSKVTSRTPHPPSSPSRVRKRLAGSVRESRRFLACVPALGRLWSHGGGVLARD
jgi:hypothetical protein